VRRKGDSRRRAKTDREAERARRVRARVAISGSCAMRECRRSVRIGFAELCGREKERG